MSEKKKTSRDKQRELKKSYKRSGKSTEHVQEHFVPLKPPKPKQTTKKKK